MSTPKTSHSMSPRLQKSLKINSSLDASVSIRHPFSSSLPSSNGSERKPTVPRPEVTFQPKFMSNVMNCFLYKRIALYFFALWCFLHPNRICSQQCLFSIIFFFCFYCSANIYSLNEWVLLPFHISFCLTLKKCISCIAYYKTLHILMEVLASGISLHIFSRI